MATALAHIRQSPPLGECTLVLGGAPPKAEPIWDPEALRQELQELVEGGMGSKEAAKALAERSGHNKRELYALLHARETEAT